MDLHPLFLQKHRRPSRGKGRLYGKVVQIYLARGGPFLLCAQHNEQLRRRFSAVVRLKGYDLYVRKEAEQFVALLGALRSFLPVSSVDFLTKEMIQRFHFASNGLIDYLIKVLDRAAWQVLIGRSRGIDNTVLSQAFHDEVWAEAPPERNPFDPAFNFKPLSGAREPFEAFDGQ